MLKIIHCHIYLGTDQLCLRTVSTPMTIVLNLISIMLTSLIVLTSLNGPLAVVLIVIHLFTDGSLLIVSFWPSKAISVLNTTIMLINNPTKLGGCNSHVDLENINHWLNLAKESIASKNYHHHQSLWSDEHIQWDSLINLIVGCKNKRGSFFIEICCQFVKENIGTKFATFCEGKYLLRSLQSQSKFLSKCSNPKYLHVHLKHFWRSPKVQVAQTNYVSSF